MGPPPTWSSTLASSITLLTLEVTARTGLRCEEMRQGVMQRCVSLLKANDSILTVAGFRCLLAIGDAKQIPFEIWKSSMVARNAPIELVAYLAASQMADEGVGLPDNFTNCTYFSNEYIFGWKKERIPIFCRALENPVKNQSCMLLNLLEHQI
jgi:hypothetical protein